MKEKVSYGSALLAVICVCSLADVGCSGFSTANSQNTPPPSLSINGSITPTAVGSGISIALSGAASATATTDGSGNYSFTGLANGSYKLTPSKSGYSFNPATQTVVIITAGATGIDFVASQSSSPPSTYSITGTISPATNGSGVSVTLSGAATAYTTTDSQGNFSFSSLDNGTYTVTPSKSGYTCSPSSLSVTISGANVTGENFTAASNTPPPTYTFSGTISPAANGSGAKVTLSGAASATTTAGSSGNYSFSGLAPGSYSATPSKSGFTFSPTVQSATITSANVTGENFTATPISSTAPGLMISGTISPITNSTGVTVTLSGAASSSTTTDSSGHYSFAGLGSGSYSITPSKSGFEFFPPNHSTTLSSADARQVNFTAASQSAIVNITPGEDVASIVATSPAGTTFVIAPGTYRLTKSITTKNNDSFVGQTACAPPATSCPAVISGSSVIGSLATFNGTNYVVTGQTQQGATGAAGICDPGWSGCIYPEDLFFDGVPYQHLNSPTLPAIGHGQWWFDYTNHIIYFHDNPAGHTVETSVLNNGFGGAANNVTIQYLSVKEFADMYPAGAIGVIQTPNPLTTGINWTIQYSEVLLNHGYGVRAGYFTGVFNNYIHNNGQMGIGGGVGTTSTPSTESINSGILIEGNLITYNDYAHFNPNFGSGGFKAGSTSGITLRGNTIQHNEGAGIHFDVNSLNESVDGNLITDNSDADGLEQEIGYGTSTFRNNILLRNGAPLNSTNNTSQIAVRSSAGVSAYCNTMEIPNAVGTNGWSVIASNRGNSLYPPYQYLATINNSFHHNTLLWDSGATGGVGFLQSDAANQPNFFADNTPPDFNTYHLLTDTAAKFIYDNNNSQNNTNLTFPQYQAAGADVHGAADANYTSGYPEVLVTSPADQTAVAVPATISATASDTSGISKVEFYVDWTLETTVTSPPYDFNWTSATAGQHTVAAMASSNAGIQACYAITLNTQ